MPFDLEHATLPDCEAIVQRGIDAAFEAGRALMHIRDERLYKGRYANFEMYCQTRWGFTRSRSSQLIMAAEVHHVLEDTIPATASVNGGSPNGHNGSGSYLPANERVARELTPLLDRKDDLVGAWHEATSKAAQYDRQPTSTDVRAAVQGRVMGPVARTPTKPVQGSEELVDAIVEAWALVAHGAKEVIKMERDLLLKGDLTDTQRWKVREAQKHALMAIER
jgi:hypothetical protein